MNSAADCPRVSAELAHRNAYYARSAAGRAELLWEDGAISRNEYLQRVAPLARAERCLEMLIETTREDNVLLLDDEQIGLD